MGPTPSSFSLHSHGDTIRIGRECLPYAGFFLGENGFTKQQFRTKANLFAGFFLAKKFTKTQKKNHRVDVEKKCPSSIFGFVLKARNTLEKNNWAKLASWLPVCRECNHSLMNEYPNVFVSAKYLRMNVRIYSFDYVFYKCLFKYFCPCSIITNEFTNIFEEPILTKYFCQIK